MISVKESKIYCCYCRSEIYPDETGQMMPDQEHQYHQECFNEIIKDNHCEYCLEILNELNELFKEQHIKIHQKCTFELEKLIRKHVTTTIIDYLQMFPMKKLAKDCAFYEMNETHFLMYLDDLKKSIDLQLPDFADKSEPFHKYIANIATEVTEKVISEYITTNLDEQLIDELKKVHTQSKKEYVNKILNFMWIYYLEVPISYKDKAHHKVLPAPVLDNVNYIIFHYKLENLLKTKLDFNAVVNSNFNDLSEYLVGQPISLEHFKKS